MWLIRKGHLFQYVLLKCSFEWLFWRTAIVLRKCDEACGMSIIVQNIGKQTHKKSCFAWIWCIWISQARVSLINCAFEQSMTFRCYHSMLDVLKIDFSSIFSPHRKVIFRFGQTCFYNILWSTLFWLNFNCMRYPFFHPFISTWMIKL